jgi:hypothetical protein
VFRRSYLYLHLSARHRCCLQKTPLAVGITRVQVKCLGRESVNNNAVLFTGPRLGRQYLTLPYPVRWNRLLRRVVREEVSGRSCLRDYEETWLPVLAAVALLVQPSREEWILGGRRKQTALHWPFILSWSFNNLERLCVFFLSFNLFLDRILQKPAAGHAMLYVQAQQLQNQRQRHRPLSQCPRDGGTSPPRVSPCQVLITPN